MTEATRANTARRFPWLLCTALIACLGISQWLIEIAPRFVDSLTLVYLEKLRRAVEGPDVDVMILGASQTVAAIIPEVLEEALPPGTRVYNFGAPAMAPSGGEALLRHYLASNAPPKLLVLSFSPMIYGDQRGEFERFTLRYSLGLREVALAVLADRRPYYLLGWLATRIGAVRYREGLRSSLLADAADRLPALRAGLHAWMGYPDDPLADYRFEWRYTERAARNRALLEQLERDRGWHYWKESASAGRFRRAAPGWRSPDPRPPLLPFSVSPREGAALERILELCREHGVSVYVPGMPHPRWFARRLRSGTGASELASFWSGLAERPGVSVAPTPILVYPQELFADLLHVGPEGAERFSRELAEPVARAFARQP